MIVSVRLSEFYKGDEFSGFRKFVFGKMFYFGKERSEIQL
jgi:hypothetical protein